MIGSSCYKHIYGIYYIYLSALPESQLIRRRRCCCRFEMSTAARGHSPLNWRPKLTNWQDSRGGGGEETRRSEKQLWRQLFWGKQSSKVKGGCGGRAGACYASLETYAIKRDFASINRRVALAILTHMLSNLFGELLLFFGNVNKQGAGSNAQWAECRRKSVLLFFVFFYSHYFQAAAANCFQYFSFLFLFIFIFRFFSGHFQCGTLQLRLLLCWRQRMHFIALNISVISAHFALVIQSALGNFFSILS